MKTSRPMTASRPIRAPRRICARCQTAVPGPMLTSASRSAVAWICADGSITGLRLLAVSRPMTGSGSISGIGIVSIGIARVDDGRGRRDQALAAAEVGSLGRDRGDRRQDTGIRRGCGGVGRRRLRCRDRVEQRRPQLLVAIPVGELQQTAGTRLDVIGRSGVDDPDRSCPRPSSRRSRSRRRAARGASRRGAGR